MIETEKKAEYTEFLKSSEGINILLLAGYGQKDKIMKNSLLNLMADVLHPNKQDDVYAHPNLLLREIDLTQSTPEALQGACKDVRFAVSEFLSESELKRLRALNGQA